MPDAAKRTPFGIRHAGTLRVADRGVGLVRKNRACLDAGPFYLRWVADFDVDDTSGNSVAGAPGIAELLDTRNLHKAWFNWMIPYRLKWPEA